MSSTCSCARQARQYRNVSVRDCRVSLVEISDRILPALDEDLADYAAEQMRLRGMDIHLNNSVTAVDGRGVDLADGRRLSTRTLIWCAGIQPNPQVARLGLPTDVRGYILCETDLRVKGCADTWAIGDCAVNLDPQGRPYPPTAQHAIKEGIAAAQNIARRIRGEATRPFVYRSRGALAAFGCRTGVARFFGMKLSGFPAWFLWRTVYLMKIPGVARKARIALDWTADLLFRRDYVQLGVHRAPPPRTPGRSLGVGGRRRVKHVQHVQHVQHVHHLVPAA